MFFLILKERLGVGWEQSLFCQSHLFYYSSPSARLVSFLKRLRE